MVRWFPMLHPEETCHNIENCLYCSLIGLLFTMIIKPIRSQLEANKMPIRTFSKIPYLLIKEVRQLFVTFIHVIKLTVQIGK